MVLRVDIGDMDIEQWEVLYLKSRDYCSDIRIKQTRSTVMDIYLNDKYGAERVSTCEVYEFSSKEQYTEFYLKWM